MNRGVFNLNGLEFIDHLSKERIYVELSLIQSIEK